MRVGVCVLVAVCVAVLCSRRCLGSRLSLCRCLFLEFCSVVSCSCSLFWCSGVCVGVCVLFCSV